jgi:uncharacterized protein (TIGR00297 family)
MSAIQVAGGFLLAAVVAGAAYSLGSLTPGGAAAAVVVGGLTFGLGGLVPGLLLILFFVTSSALSRLGPRRKAGVAARFEKGGRRDAGQVIANGGAASVLAVAYGFAGAPVLMAALAGALAAVTADTWATELGVLSRRPPRLITSGKTVEAGTSGAVSREGLIAAVGGSALIAVVAGWGTASAAVAVAALVGGVLGAVADSVLGATVQAMFFCPACGKETERHPTHACGTATTAVRGWRWLRNDEVNLAASFGGAAAAAILFSVLG